MRLSVDHTDPGYEGWLKYRSMGTVRVFLEGAELRYVFTADEDARQVVVPVLDAGGRMQLNPDRTDVLRETLYGHVRIELPAEPDHG